MIKTKIIVIIMCLILVALAVREIQHKGIVDEYRNAVGFSEDFFDKDAKVKSLNVNKWIGDPRHYKGAK